SQIFCANPIPVLISYNSLCQYDPYFIEVTTKEKVPNISNKVWCLALYPTFSISFVRIDFCALTIRGLSGITRPSKYFFNVATPLLIHSKVGSSFGTSDALGST